MSSVQVTPPLALDRTCWPTEMHRRGAGHVRAPGIESFRGRRRPVQVVPPDDVASVRLPPGDCQSCVRHEVADQHEIPSPSPPSATWNLAPSHRLPPSLVHSASPRPGSTKLFDSTKVDPTATHEIGDPQANPSTAPTPGGAGSRLHFDPPSVVANTKGAANTVPLLMPSAGPPATRHDADEVHARLTGSSTESTALSGGAGAPVTRRSVQVIPPSVVLSSSNSFV